MNTLLQLAGATNTAILFFGHRNVAPGGATLTENWNGSAWTEVNDINTGRPSVGGSGTYTSAIASAGGSTRLLKLKLQKIWNGNYLEKRHRFKYRPRWIVEDQQALIIQKV